LLGLPGASRVKDWANTRKETHIVSVNTYETVFIAEPEISNDQVDQLISKIKQAIATHQGTVTGEDRWGRRRLAYPIHGHREGFYAVLNFTAAAEVVNAIEHLYNVTDSVVRHLTVRIIKKNKTFRPRREKPAGHADASRHGGPRSSGGYRGRPDAATHAKPAAAPAAETAAPAAPAGETPQGGTPS
jgi:small subunit ribosomal protein S6